MLSMESRQSTDSLSLSDRQSNSSALFNFWNASYKNAAPFNLTDGCARDITSAIGDKEVAAQAVAFVVNSTRKGIVPLCADVANLLRVKKSLEDKVSQLIRENDLLRSGASGSHIGLTSPTSLSASTVTQPNVHNDTSEQRFSPQRTSTDENLTVNTSSDIQTDCQFKPVSPALCTSHTDSSQPLNPDAENNDTTFAHHRSDSMSSCGHESNRSLEMDPSSEAWQATIHQQLTKTMQLNNRLSQDLRSAHTTIEKLQSDIKTLKIANKNNNLEHVKNNMTPHRQYSAPEILNNQNDSSYNSYLPNLCANCSRTKSPLPIYPHHNSYSLRISPSIQVNIGDTVQTQEYQAGCVKYIGHLDSFSKHTIFAGLQLKHKVSGGTDGSVNGRKYFSCSKGKGIFVTASEILSIIPLKKSTLNSTLKNQSMEGLEQAPSSSSSSGSNPGLVEKLRKAVSLKHTCSHKRISLPSASSTTSEVLPTPPQSHIPNSAPAHIPSSPSAQIPNSPPAQSSNSPPTQTSTFPPPSQLRSNSFGLPTDEQSEDL